MTTDREHIDNMAVETQTLANAVLILIETEALATDSKQHALIALGELNRAAECIRKLSPR